MLVGLERFEYTATLGVRVRSTTSLGTGVAEIVTQEFVPPAIPAVSEAPEIVQELYGGVGPMVYYVSVGR